MINKTHIIFTLISLFIFVAGCKDDEETNINSVPNSSPTTENKELPEIDQRNFSMGFTTWSYGPNFEDREDTYSFLASNADIYTEQFDNKIPWTALFNNQSLPTEYVNEVDGRVQRLISGNQLILYAGLLNIDRDDIIEDYDGSIPTYDSLNEQKIEDAYFKHLDYLIGRFNPDYLIASVECNELLIHDESKWQQYRKLMKEIRRRIKAKYPSLQLSESVTLHNWFELNSQNASFIEKEIRDYVNQLDFVSVSFYPYFKGLKEKEDFQRAFDFLHQEVSKPLAFIETCHLAEDLVVPNLNLSIPSDEQQQKEYLSSLFLNAHEHDYHFVIWWTHRDFDRLWETFPESVKDLGQIWRDTGILDEDGNKRPSFFLWEDILNR